MVKRKYPPKPIISLPEMVARLHTQATKAEANAELWNLDDFLVSNRRGTKRWRVPADTVRTGIAIAVDLGVLQYDPETTGYYPSPEWDAERILAAVEQALREVA